ncbi:hypothetical protein TanjilG_07158 [Lupinus angustifolius]|uniref:Reverse transcriptase domain-containing protein n=1 Tax=Lupinus angustifolius TaxID=3871 RepID=A0A1J7GMW6_LUPAN|nr:hypothetical protein TanjilG_07158 [Lupinus angustifolius]
MQPRVAQFLQLPISPTPKFPVMVGNGERTYCTGLCKETPINLQQQLFTIPFYLLPIQRADVVLGIEWLSTLGPVTSDFSVPSMTFTHDHKPITLTGQHSHTPTLASFHQLRRLSNMDAIAYIFYITIYPQATMHTLAVPEPDTNNPITDLHPDIQTLLQDFDNVFTNPTGLPPPRPHDYKIILLPNQPPANVKPYRYPHSQKEAMATLLVDMLQQGIVTLSTSPFSSPVLLVRKKDGSCQFCVDYRNLNAITFKNRFPIPTIDELLDELAGASIFSKIDLQLGYHQIRLDPADTHKTAFRTADGHYEFLVMPFRLTNGPSTFQSAMNDLLRPFIRKFVLVFLMTY